MTAIPLRTVARSTRKYASSAMVIINNVTLNLFENGFMDYHHAKSPQFPLASVQQAFPCL